MPTAERYCRAEIRDNEFIKLYQGKNATHGDRETAKNIVANLVMAPQEVINNNPYLSKTPQPEQEINLCAIDLMNLGQITPEMYEKNRLATDDEIYS